MGISKKAIISGKEILDYIPQRSPIVMVDEFYGVDQEKSYSALLISEDNMFCDEGELSDCGLIEHIAQSAALRVGYIYKSQDKNIPLGYIGSVNQLKIAKLPLIGEQLHTEICVEHEVMNITVILATCFVEGKEIAKCKMKIYLQE